jgi:hypothetical protein
MVEQRLNNGIPRTSNLIEGWHHRFQHKLGCHRPSMWRFLLEIIREQNRTENTYARIQIDKFPSITRRKYAYANYRLKKAYQKFRSTEEMCYLQSIAEFV